MFQRRQLGADLSELVLSDMGRCLGLLETGLQAGCGGGKREEGVVRDNDGGEGMSWDCKLADEGGRGKRDKGK